VKSSNAQLQNYMEKAFHDARRDWDSGLQVRWPTAGGGAAARCLTESSDYSERSDDTGLDRWRGARGEEVKRSPLCALAPLGS
jgi:hypothetical protein